jgi:hypothetical protein
MSGGPEDDDLDVEAILARAAALRQRAAELDLDLSDRPTVDDPATPRRRDTLVPPAEMELPSTGSEPAPAPIPEPEPEPEPAPIPESEPEPEPAPPPLPPDPFAAANAALARAREARGVGPDVPKDAPSDDPFAAAMSALDRAEAARGVDLQVADPLAVDADPMAAARAALELAQQARSAFARVDSERVLREAKLRAFKKRLQEAEARLDAVEAAREVDAFDGADDDTEET